MKKLQMRRLSRILIPAAFLAGCSSVPEETLPAPQTAASFSAVPLITGVLPINEVPEAETTTSAAAVTEPAELPPDENARATIAFAGDTTQSDVFGSATLWRDITYPFEDVAGIFTNADLAFVNLETSVSSRGESEKPSGYGFRTDPELLDVYTTAGIDIVSCANNHTRDYGYDALSDTFAHLKDHDIAFVGAGNDLKEAQKLEIFDLNGIKAGFTACNMINMNPTWYAAEDRAGLMCVDFDDCEDYLALISQYSERCDVLFVSVHWGIEYVNAITNEQREFAHRLCENGADIILGHHPHMLQPIEKYGDSMIFYSLGNFLFYKMDDDAGKTALFEIEIDRNGFVAGKMHPVFINYCKSNLLSQSDAMYEEILGLVRSISVPYGVTLDENGGINSAE